MQKRYKYNSKKISHAINNKMKKIKFNFIMYPGKKIRTNNQPQFDVYDDTQIKQFAQQFTCSILPNQFQVDITKKYPEIQEQDKVVITKTSDKIEQESLKNKRIQNLLYTQSQSFSSFIKRPLNNNFSSVFRHPDHDLSLKRNKLMNNQHKLQQKFRVMSYNILADYLVNKEEYSEEHHKSFVQWQIRWQQIHKEIQHYNPEILCLQEFEATEEHLCSHLQNDGYKKIYVRRSESKIDGCAIYYKPQRFELVAEQLLNLAAPHIDEYFLDRPNVVALALLLDRESGQHVLVANSHLLFNLNRGDIKILQLQIVLACVRRMISHLRDVSFVWCGDFNAIPCSPLYEYLSQGTFNFSRTDLKGVSCQASANFKIQDRNKPYVMKLLHQNNRIYSAVNQFAFISMSGYKRWLELFNSLDVNTEGQLSITQSQINSKFQMNERLFSAYAECTFAALNVNDRAATELYERHSTCEPLITSMSRSTKGTVDYIWYCNTYNESRQLQVQSIIEMPLTSDLLKYDVYPNFNFPSDHIALVVDFGYV